MRIYVALVLFTSWSMAVMAAPQLQSQAQPQHLAFVPNHEQVSYLLPSSGAGDKFDLWIYDIAEQQHRAILTDISSQYHWSPNGAQLLVSMDGRLFLLNMHADAPLLEAITTTAEVATQAQFSPQGTYVSFLVDAQLQRIEVATRQRESYDLHTRRYWWSPNEDYIAVADTQADKLSSRQSLAIIDVNNHSVDRFSVSDSPQGYLTEVQWLPDSQRLSYQWLDRPQQNLTLWLVNYSPGESVNAASQSSFERSPLLTETSPTWVDAEHHLHLLNDRKHFIWTSARSGYNHIYLYRLDGKLIRQISSGNWDVEQVHGADNTTGVVYFSAREKSPLELHLYRASLSTGNPSQPTRISAPDGEHKVAFDARLRNYLDYFSSPSQPPQVSLHGPTGQRIQWLQQNPQPPQAPQSDFGQLEAANGATLHYRLIKPADFDAQQKYPVLVRLNGSANTQQVSQRWPDEADLYFSKQGYLIFHLDNRGTSGRGYDFAHSIYQNLGTVELNDQRQGIAFLQQLDYVESEQLLLLSDFEQGYLSLASWLQEEVPYAAVAAFNPIVDWRFEPPAVREKYLGQTPTAEATDVSAAAVYQRANLIHRLDRLSTEQKQQRPPLLLVYTAQTSQQREALQQLQKRGLPFQYMWYPAPEQATAHQLELLRDFFARQQD